MMCGLSDDPGQFRESPFSALFRQADRERRRQFRSESMDYMTMKF
jgi:hypothetical protein